MRECVRAMSLFHKAKATRFTPWLGAATVPLFAFSCVSLSAQEPPWEGCRAASKIEYESAKRDFLLQTKPVLARMQRLAIGGGVIIGIAAYSNSAPMRPRTLTKEAKVLLAELAS